MSNSTEEIKKLENRISSIEKQIKEILNTIDNMKTGIKSPPSPGFVRANVRKRLPHR